MSIAGKLLGEAGAGAARGLLDGLGDFGDHVKSWITGEPNPETKAKMEEQWMNIQALLAKGQTAINEEEAKSTSVFVAGWRPAVGWICALALGWNYVFYPMVVWGMAIWAPNLTIPPMIPTGALYPILMGMLGIGGMRSWEKSKDIQGKH